MILDSLLAYKNLKRSFYDDKSCMYLPMAKTSDLVRYLSANRVYSRRKCALKNAITQFSDKIIKKKCGTRRSCIYLKQSKEAFTC